MGINIIESPLLTDPCRILTVVADRSNDTISLYLDHYFPDNGGESQYLKYSHHFIRLDILTDVEVSTHQPPANVLATVRASTPYPLPRNDCLSPDYASTGVT